MNDADQPITFLAPPIPRSAHLAPPVDQQVHPVAGLGIAIQRRSRANGQTGVSPVALGDEHELGRFMGLITAAAAPNGDPRAVARLCSGGGEILLTDRRVGAIVITGESAFGRLDEDHGSILVLDLPFDAIESVELDTKHKLLGGVKAVDVKVVSVAPAGALRLEPDFTLDEASQHAQREVYSDFADRVVAAAVDYRLSQVTDEAERSRLERVKDGERTTEEHALVALLQPER